MLRPLFFITSMALASMAQAGIIGVGGSTSDLAPEEMSVQLLYMPTLKVDAKTYKRIEDRLSQQSRVNAVFRGEKMELMKVHVDGQDKVVESKLRLKLIKQP